jgi:uncharacterized membrane protein YhdT
MEKKQLDRIEANNKYIVWTLGLFLLTFIGSVITSFMTNDYFIYFGWVMAAEIVAIIAIVFIGLCKLRK